MKGMVLPSSVEKAIGCHIGFVSVGAERDSLIIR